ncbi:MAG: nucleoside hydrolase [Bacteroidales bacterium]|nr:nucleoside hydrolase [Bacteroidales bacterium]
MRAKTLLVFIAIGNIFLFDSCTKDPSPVIDSHTNMIIDTDAGIDDAMAILYLLQHPDFNVDGITISGTGMSSLGSATKNVLGLIELAGKPNIPVTKGDTVAINSQNTLLRPPEWITESNTMMGLDLPINPNKPGNKNAVDFIIEYLSNIEKPVRIMALGPLTNLGQVLEQNPGLAEKIESIYIMGGAVNVPGNLQDGGIDDNPYAEWNIFLDPDAAGIVFQSVINVILVPLDATNKAPVTNEFYIRFTNDHNTPEADFVYGMMSKLMEVYDTFYFWDPLAAVISTDQTISNIQNFPLQVVTEQGDENGRTKIDQVSGNSIKVCQDTEMNDFEDMFLDVLNGRK